jgi:hypothetical protein
LYEREATEGVMGFEESGSGKVTRCVPNTEFQRCQAALPFQHLFPTTQLKVIHLMLTRDEAEGVEFEGEVCILDVEGLLWLNSAFTRCALRRRGEWELELNVLQFGHLGQGFEECIGELSEPVLNIGQEVESKSKMELESGQVVENGQHLNQLPSSHRMLDSGARDNEFLQDIGIRQERLRVPNPRCIGEGIGLDVETLDS